MFGAEQRAVLDRYEMEHDNIRAVLDRSTAAGDAVTGESPGGQLRHFCVPL